MRVGYFVRLNPRSAGGQRACTEIKKTGVAAKMRCCVSLALSCEQASIICSNMFVPKIETLSPPTNHFADQEWFFPGGSRAEKFRLCVFPPDHLSKW